MIFLMTVPTVTAVTIVKNTFSVLLERAIWHTSQPMWCFQGSILQFLQCFCGEDAWIFCAMLRAFLVKRLNKFFLVEWLHDFKKRGCVIFCMERLHDFCVRRGCVIFVTHSLRLHDLIFSGGCIFFFCWEVMWFFVKRLHYLLCEEHALFILWRGCMIFCEEFFSKKKSCIRETKHLLTDADSSTDTTVGWTRNTPNPIFF